MSKTEFQNRITELIAKGWSPKAAEKRASKERRLKSPQHKTAVARRLGMADARYEVTGKIDSYNQI